MTKIIRIFLLSVAVLPLAVQAQDTLYYDLAACRNLALQSTNHSQMSSEAQLVAKYNRQAAIAAMTPQISANASYMWNSRKAHLLSDSRQMKYGTVHASENGVGTFQWDEEHFPYLEEKTGQLIADTYQELYNALTVDLTHVVVAQVGITQPIYVGGRLRELYNIARTAERMVSIESDAKHDELILAVDEAYWRVISVEEKCRLAHRYYDLLAKLDQDVQALIEEGMATQSDLLNVRSKLGEAEVKRLQADNGLILSRMALAQLCGLPLDAAFHLDPNGLTDHLPMDLSQIDIEQSVASRSELQLLEQSQHIARSNTRIMAAGLQPNIVASANYIYTNPNVENGLSNDWHGKGFFTAGVVVNVPIVHAEDILRVKAAKHEERLLALKVDETRELLTLQTTQAEQRLMEAQQKVAQTTLNLQNAQEILRMAEESFRAGMIPASDLQKAQTNWWSAASDQVDAQVEERVTETLLRRYIHCL